MDFKTHYLQISPFDSPVIYPTVGGTLFAAQTAARKLFFKGPSTQST